MDTVVETKDWPYKLLDKQHHARLAESIQDVCAMSGVPVDMLDHSMKESGCSPEEIEWVRNDYPTLHTSKRKGGLMLVGRKFKPTPENRLMAMGAAFLRNFIDARVVTLYGLLPLGENDEMDFSPTVLIVPDFHRKSSTGGHSLPNWRVRYLYSLLLDRFLQRRATVLHLDSEDELIAEYGQSFHDFLWSNWQVIESN